MKPIDNLLKNNNERITCKMTEQFINNQAYASNNIELKSVYNKWCQRQFGKRIPVHIFCSGSEGNSIYLKPQKTLIDIGLPFKRYIEYNPNFFVDVDYIIVTHHHGDHLNPSTLIKVLKTYPHIKFIMSDFMWKMIRSDHFKPEYEKREKDEPIPFGHNPIFKTDQNGQRIKKPSKWQSKFDTYQTRRIAAISQTLTTHEQKQFLLEPLTVKHGDIINIAIQITDENMGLKLLYASDLDNLNGEQTFYDCFNEKQYVNGLSQNTYYNCIFLEANYDENILKEWYNSLDQNDPKYFSLKARADNNLRHISEQETKRYVEKYLTENGLFIPLHASKTFGTLYQD